jgi:uncharacterized protein
VSFLVVDTDGAWEQTDSLKTAYAGAPATGMTVFSHSVDQVVEHAGFAASRGGLANLCSQCRNCPVVHICGGGLYAHRYRASNGFDNPSAYCVDLMSLIRQIAESGLPAPGHRLSPDSLENFAAGPGDIAGMAVLAASHLSITRALVAGVAAGSAPGEAELRKTAEAGWQLLTELDARQPDAVAQVLAYPYVRQWAVRCLRPRPGADLGLDRAHLAGVAASAALRAGQSAELVLPVRNGWMHLPGAGALWLPKLRARTVVARIDRAGTVTAPGHDGVWLPVRRTRSPGLAVALEDMDPFRDCHDWPPAHRLGAPELGTWRSAVAAAGHELDGVLPEYSAVLRFALQAVVPLRADITGRSRSATARHAFGGVGAALPGDLAMLLAHEYQHVKLNALLDLYPLLDPSRQVLMNVPWRPDPRPAEGVMHGIYAHLAVTALWRARAADEVPGTEPDSALARFRRHRDDLDPVIDALASTDVLTATGEVFVAGIRRTVDRWMR